MTAEPDVIDARRSRRWAYLLLLPGMAWLVIFFVVPVAQLFTVSLQSRDVTSSAAGSAALRRGTTTERTISSNCAATSAVRALFPVRVAA